MVRHDVLVVLVSTEVHVPLSILRVHPRADRVGNEGEPVLAGGTLVHAAPRAMATLVRLFPEDDLAQPLLCGVVTCVQEGVGGAAGTHGAADGDGGGDLLADAIDVVGMHPEQDVGVEAAPPLALVAHKVVLHATQRGTSAAS